MAIRPRGNYHLSALFRKSTMVGDRTVVGVTTCNTRRTPSAHMSLSRVYIRVSDVLCVCRNVNDLCYENISTDHPACVLPL